MYIFLSINELKSNTKLIFELMHWDLNQMAVTCRRQSEIHLLEWKFLYTDSNFTNHDCSWGPNGLGNGLTLTKRQAITGSNTDLDVRQWVNSVWPRDALWRHRSGSPLAQVMARSYSISQEICTRLCCALLCCGYAIVHNEFTWRIYPYSSGLLCWHWGNR